ncbi:DUF551 domain-containing protein [Aquaspirillum soli]
MSHTKEPWVLCQQDGDNKAFTIFAECQLKDGRIGPEEWGCHIAEVGLASGNFEANARRIVACVNSCVGISTENLEDNKPIIELANDYNAVLKQRNELRTALEEAIEYLEALEEVIESLELRAECGELGVNLLPRLKAVIASVKGGESPNHNDGWISVLDRLPERFLQVLVTVEEDGERFVEIDAYQVNDWCSPSNGRKVTHWRPLLEPAAEQKGGAV